MNVIYILMLVTEIVKLAIAILELTKNINKRGK